MSPPERLTPQEERDLVIAAESGSPDACQELVSAFLPAIVGVAGNYPTGSGVDRQELVQEGVAGLLVAARRFDTGLDIPFWAYASFWVRKAMQELVAELTRPVALSDRAVRALAKLKAARREHLLAHRVEPTDEQLSAATGFTLAQLESLRPLDRSPRGMEEPVSPDAAATVAETLTDPSAERAYEQVLDRIELGELWELAGELDERERAVIRAHYGLGQPAQTLKQIGRALGLTAERARQIEAGALDKLRDALAHAAGPQASGRFLRRSLSSSRSSLSPTS
jgi:RNA polymerase primary sigma factor